MLCTDLLSLYLGINCSLHDLSISVPGDLSSRFGSRGSAGEVVRCVGLQTYNGATFHHRVRGRNCEAAEKYRLEPKSLITASGKHRAKSKEGKLVLLLSLY